MQFPIFEFIIVIFLFLFAVLYYVRRGDSVYKFIKEGSVTIYDKYAPFSYKNIRRKVKELGQEYTFKDYVIQLIMFGEVLS